MLSLLLVGAMVSDTAHEVWLQSAMPFLTEEDKIRHSQVKKVPCHVLHAARASFIELARSVSQKLAPLRDESLLVPGLVASCKVTDIHFAGSDDAD